MLHFSRDQSSYKKRSYSVFGNTTKVKLCEKNVGNDEEIIIKRVHRAKKVNT